MALPSLNLPSFSGGAPKLIVIVIAGVAVGATISGLLSKQKKQQIQIQQLSQQLQTSQGQVAQLEAKNKDLTGQLASLQTDRKNLEERLESLRTQLSTAGEELDRVKLSFQEFQDQYQQLEEERGALQSRLSEVISEREEAQRRADQTAQENAKLQRNVTRMKDRLGLLDRDYRELSKKMTQMENAPHSGLNLLTEIPSSADAVAVTSSTPSPPQAAGLNTIELPPIVVRKDQAAIASPVRGRVVEINDPHNFVVLDQGSRDGVRVGMAFDIVRGSETVGRANVVRVRPNLSACDIVRAKTPGPIQSGDVVVQAGL